MANFFILHLYVISLFAPANNNLQAENTDLSTGMTLVGRVLKTFTIFEQKRKFCDICNKVVTQINSPS